MVHKMLSADLQTSKHKTAVSIVEYVIDWCIVAHHGRFYLKLWRLSGWN